MNGIGIIVLTAIVGQAPVLPSSGTDYGWQVDGNKLTYIVQISPELLEKNRLRPEPFTSDIPQELEGRISRVAIIVGNGQLPRDPPLEKINQLIPSVLPKIETESSPISPSTSLNASRFKDVEPDVYPISGTNSPGQPAPLLPSRGASSSLSDTAGAAGLSASNSLRDSTAPSTDLLAQSELSRFQNDPRGPLTSGMPNPTTPPSTSRFNSDQKPASAPLTQAQVPPTPPSLTQPSTRTGAPTNSLLDPASDYNNSRSQAMQRQFQASNPQSPLVNPNYPAMTSASAQPGSALGGYTPPSNSYSPGSTANSQSNPPMSGGLMYQGQSQTLPGMQPLPASPSSTFAAPTRIATGPAYNNSAPTTPNQSYAPNYAGVPTGYDPATYSQFAQAQMPNAQAQQPLAYQQPIYATTTAPQQPIQQLQPVHQGTTAGERTLIASNGLPNTGLSEISRGSRSDFGDDPKLESEEEKKRKAQEEDKRRTDEGILRVFFLLSLVVNFYLGVIIRKLRTRYRSLLASSRNQSE